MMKDGEEVTSRSICLSIQRVMEDLWERSCSRRFGVTGGTMCLAPSLAHGLGTAQLCQENWRQKGRIRGHWETGTQMHSFSETLVTVNSRNRYGEGNVLYTYKYGILTQYSWHLQVWSGGSWAQWLGSRPPQGQSEVDIVWDKQGGVQTIQVRPTKRIPEIPGRDLGWQGEVLVA